MRKYDSLLTAINGILLVIGFMLAMMPWVAICWRLTLTWSYVWEGISGLVIFIGVLAVAIATE